MWIGGAIVLTSHPVVTLSTLYRSTKPVAPDLPPSGDQNISILSAFYLPPAPSTWLLSPCWLTSSVFSHQGWPLFLAALTSAGAPEACRRQASPGLNHQEQASVPTAPCQGITEKRCFQTLSINTKFASRFTDRREF